MMAHSAIIHVDWLIKEKFSCFCSELGQRFSNSFENVDNVFDQLDWYLFPIRIQRLVPMAIMNVQQPVEIKCFGNILCCREQFKKVSSINQLLLFGYGLSKLYWKFSIFIRRWIRRTLALWHFVNFIIELVVSFYGKVFDRKRRISMNFVIFVNRKSLI